MSHITNIQTQITQENLPLAKKAAEALGLKVTENEIVRAWNRQQVRCTQVYDNGGPYKAGLSLNDQGTYDLVADWEMAHNLTRVMGKNGVKFLDEYNLEVIKERAKRLGLPINVQRVDGEIRVSVGVKTNA